MSKTADFIKSRKGAVIFLASACLISSIFITSNLSAAQINDGEALSTMVYAKAANTVEIVNQADFAFSSNVVVSSSDASSDSNIVTILRAFDITVVDAGESKTVSVLNGSSVQEALETAGIDLPDDDDEMNYNLTDSVEENMVITLDRVEYETTTVTKTIAYSTVTKKDSTLASGTTKVSVEGVNGSKEVTTTKKIVNGVVTKTTTTEKVTKEAVDEVIIKGTKVSTSSNSSSKTSSYSVNTSSNTITINGTTFSYSKVLTGSGTAYTASSGAKTATGQTARVGLVAVNPSVIPYGTKLYIVAADGSYTYGYAVAADTGSALRNGSALVDLFMNTQSECISFGRRQVKVYVLS